MLEGEKMYLGEADGYVSVGLGIADGGGDVDEVGVVGFEKFVLVR